MRNRLVVVGRFLFWAVAIAVLVLSLGPQPRGPTLQLDKLEHLTAFIVLTVLAKFAYPGRRVAVLGVALVAAGRAY